MASFNVPWSSTISCAARTSQCNPPPQLLQVPLWAFLSFLFTSPEFFPVSVAALCWQDLTVAWRKNGPFVQKVPVCIFIPKTCTRRGVSAEMTITWLIAMLITVDYLGWVHEESCCKTWSLHTGQLRMRLSKLRVLTLALNFIPCELW